MKTRTLQRMAKVQSWAGLLVIVQVTLASTSVLADHDSEANLLQQANRINVITQTMSQTAENEFGHYRMLNGHGPIQKIAQKVVGALDQMIQVNQSAAQFRNAIGGGGPG